MPTTLPEGVTHFQDNDRGFFAWLGSLSAVADGALEILAGADEGVLARVRPLLDTLGEVRFVKAYHRH